MLSNLKEITLHQQNIERIELIGDVCRELEILYLQNNVIGKLENLYHLKARSCLGRHTTRNNLIQTLFCTSRTLEPHWHFCQIGNKAFSALLCRRPATGNKCNFPSPVLQALRYLNLAMNNIVRIENLQGCESLQKLDVTMNFIPVSALPSFANLSGLYDFRELHLLGNPCQSWEQHREYIVMILPQLQSLVRHICHSKILHYPLSAIVQTSFLSWIGGNAIADDVC